jgi:uncharacterized membrane protein
MLLFFIWVFPILKWALQVSWQDPQSRLATGILVGFLLSIISLFLVIAYVLGVDFTRGARYNFVYFPAVIVVVGAILAVCWQHLDNHKNLAKRLPISLNNKGKIAVALIWLMGFLGALTVIFNLGYKKYYLPDALVSIIQQNSTHQVLIAMTHQNLVQTGEIMGVAWEIKEQSMLPNPLFLLAHQKSDNSPIATKTLEQAVQSSPRPLDVWTVNFFAPVNLDNCQADSQTFPYINGYGFQHHRCLKTQP